MAREHPVTLLACLRMLVFPAARVGTPKRRACQKG